MAQGRDVFVNSILNMNGGFAVFNDEKPGTIRLQDGTTVSVVKTTQGFMVTTSKGDAFEATDKEVLIISGKDAFKSDGELEVHVAGPCTLEGSNLQVKIQHCTSANVTGSRNTINVAAEGTMINVTGSRNNVQCPASTEVNTKGATSISRV